MNVIATDVAMTYRIEEKKMKCEKCHQEIDKDSQFCSYCGARVLTKKEISKRKQFYTTKYEDNDYCDKSRNLFIIGFFAFDLILSTVVGLFQIPNIWIYGISAIIYLIAVFYGIRGIGFSLKLKKAGKHASGLITSSLMIASSLIVMFINITSVMNVL